MILQVWNGGPVPGPFLCAHSCTVGTYYSSTWPGHRTRVGVAPLLDVAYDVVTSFVLSKAGRRTLHTRTRKPTPAHLTNWVEGPSGVHMNK
jgi:hypothetical protein